MKSFQLAIPGRINLTYSQKDLNRSKEIINKFNGLSPIYRTINDFEEKPLLHNVIIQRLLFDFDVDPEYPNRELEEARKLHEFFESNQLSHCVFFSGRGFHVYLETVERRARELMNPREAVKAAHEDISRRAGVHPDPKTKDLMRVSRLPNTLNTRSKLFCIPLTFPQLYLKKEEIEELARIQRWLDVEQNDYKPLDVKDYDKPLNYIPEIEYTESGSISDKILQKELPMCVVALLAHGDCGFSERFAIITALRDLCYSPGDTKRILKKYLNPEKYLHCVREEGQVEYLYGRQDLFFPSCLTLKEQGLCVEGCNGKSKIYLED
ncbi:MAG: hypothetical protein Q8M92_04755 [Candidatus Subteraquimicrobiales bacterium]|nr:hypothetical protein [Candidatus Subteraquimicrobiales bacterium]